jgi:predicted metal-binding protein
MQPVKPKWLGKGLVLVCERCTAERIPEEDPDIAEKIGDFKLRDWLKTKMKEDGTWGPIRVISTSCLDVCARGRVTAAIVPEEGATEVMVVDPLTERDSFYEKIAATFEDPR